MEVFLQLIKLTGSNVEPSVEEKKRSKTFGAVMGVLVFLLIFLPVSFFVGFMVYALTNGLVTIGTADSVTAGLKLMLHIVALFSVVFGFSVVMSVFYFSNDLDHLLPLPISPMKIVGAKLASTMLSENVMESILVISALVGFMIGYGFSPRVGGGVNFVSFLAAIIGIVTFPILPICYCAIVCLVVMYFSKFFKNKDRVSKLTAFSSIVILIALVFALNLSNGFDTNLFVEQLVNNDIGIINVLDCVFVNVPLLSGAMAGSFLSLLLYLIVNAAAIAAVMLLASKLYLKAVVSLNGGEGAASTKKEVDFDRQFGQSSQLKAYFVKEMKILFRTPAYMSNCLGINLVWPVFIYLFLMLQKQSGKLTFFIDNLRMGDSESVLYVTMLVFGISVILTSLNCLASSAITREGRHFEVMKYMPADLMTQMNAKALVSIIISGAGLVVYIITAFIVLRLDAKLCIYCVLMSLLAVVYSTYLGIYIDTINPKLVWDDEVNALRGNYHVFYNMAIEMLVTAAVCGAAYGLYKIELFPVYFIQSVIMLFCAFMSFNFYVTCKKKGVKNLKKIET